MSLMLHTTVWYGAKRGVILLAQGWRLVLLPLHLKGSEARAVLRAVREL